MEDLVVQNGKTIKAAVIGIGGFLGMGERYVTVDPATLVLHWGSDDNIRVTTNTTKDDLKNSPTFNYKKKRRNLSPPSHIPESLRQGLGKFAERASTAGGETETVRLCASKRSGLNDEEA
ncbi:hypothetical protein [Bradyrhizobium sp. P5_C11_2]